MVRAGNGPMLLDASLHGGATPGVFVPWSQAAFDHAFTPRWWRWWPFFLMLALGVWAMRQARSEPDDTAQTPSGIKFAVASLFGIAASFLFAGLTARRTPVLRAIL